MRKILLTTIILVIGLVKLQSQTCFTPSWIGNGLDHMNFYVSKATVNGVNVKVGEEIGIFDGTTCVGIGVLTQELTGGTVLLNVKATKDDPDTPAKDGYTAGNTASFRFCTNGGTTIITTVQANYTTNTGVFAIGAYCIVELTATIDVPPTPPIVGTITQPTCTVPTGSVILSGLPATGTWTLTRSPGNVTTPGSGASTTVTGLPASGTYTFTVTNASGTSASSANVVINAVPAAPTAPVVGTITQPTCSVSTGSVVLSGLPASGAWTLTRTPGAVTTPGSGASTTVTAIPAGTYTYTVTNAAGCISPSSGNVVINAQPATPTAPVVGTITQPTCAVATGSVVLSGLPGTGSWTLIRTPGAVSTPGSGPSTTVTAIPAGTYTFTVTNAAGCISVSSANVVINIQPATPTAPIVGTITQPTCAVATGSVVLSGLPGTGSWTLTRTPGAVSTPGSGTSTTVTAIPAGTYTYTVTNASGCISVSSANVVINTVPTAPTAPVVGTITQPTCSVSTGSVVLSGLPASGTWTLTRTPGGTTTTGSGASFTVTAIPAGTYTYTVTDAAGCISPSSGNVVINAQPATPTAPVVGTITQPTCSVTTGSVVLSGLPATGTWTLTRTPGAVTTTGTGTSTTIALLAQGTYTYTVTNAAGCISVSSANIVINAVPTAPTAPVVGTITQPTCAVATGSVVLSGLPATGTWTLTRTPGAVTTTGSGTSFTVTGIPAGTFTYTVTNASGCISVSSANVVINAVPSAPTAPVVGTITQPTCSVATGSVVLSGLPATGTWTLTRTPGAVTTTGSGASFTVTAIPAGTYTYTVTDAAGCISPSSGNVVINAQPATPTAPVVGTITQPTCSVTTGSVVLSGLPATGTWTLTRTPGAVTTTGTGTSTTIALLAQGTYTYTVTNAAGCISVSSANIVINAVPTAPTAPVVGTITQPTCAVATGSVVLSGLPATGTWTLTRTPGAVTTTGSGTSFTVTGIPAGTFTYTVTNASGCISVSSANVVINAVPSAPTAPVVGTITQPTCSVATGSVVLSGLPATGTWTLTRTPGAVTTTGSGASFTVTAIPAGTYTYTVTDAAGCISPSSGNVVINAQPATPTAPVVGTITQPTCSVTTGSVVLSGLPATGTWTLTRTPGAVTTTGTGTSTTIALLAQGTYTYTVTNAAGCISVSSANIVINAVPTAPTAPVVGTITQPTCSVATGSVVLSGLPATGTWTLTRTPGAVTTTGTGTSTTVTAIPAGTYTYTVTNSSGCTSPSSGNVVLNTPVCIHFTPVWWPGSGMDHMNLYALTATLNGTALQPNDEIGIFDGDVCVGMGVLTQVLTGTVYLSMVVSRDDPDTPLKDGYTPGNAITYRVWDSSAASEVSNVVASYVSGEGIFAVGATSTFNLSSLANPPTAPVIGTITQPTCSVATGSVVLSGLPATGTWTLTRTPGSVTTTGSGTSTTIAGLAAGTYTYTVTNAAGTSPSSGNVVINAQPATPTAPAVGTITQPTCSVTTGSVVLNGLPSTGTWTLTRTPGGTTTTGTGTSRTITGLVAGTYTYTVTNASGCISVSSANVVINAVPTAPTAPAVGTITQPTCSVTTGSVVLSGLPSTGTWTLTRTPGGTTTTGTGTSRTITGLAAGTYTFTVTNESGCISGSSANVVINAVPTAPTAPAVGTITQPTCSVSTGSVVLNGLPSTGTWTLTRTPGGTTTTGTGTSRTITGLTSGTYTYTVTNASGCISSSSGDIVINTVPVAPTVTTSTVSSIDETTASGGGDITSDGGTGITERGVCWSTSSNPTISDSRSSGGTSTGSFTVTLTGLTNGVTYHIRAYATNCAGTSYGSDLQYLHNPTGVYDILINEISVFPNPVSGLLNIKYDNDDFKTINILNSAGKYIGKEKAVTPNQQLDFSGFDPGLYILEFIKPSGEIVRVKVLKNN